MRKALIFADRFFTPAVFEWATSQVPFFEGVEKVYYDLRWPEVSFSYGERLREYIPYPPEALRGVAEAEILVTQMGLVDEALLGAAPRLRVVGCLRSGPVNIDREALRKRNIPLFFVPERSVEAVAEFTLGLFILARRRILEASQEMASGLWTQSRYFCYEHAAPPLRNTVVGLLGFGKIARRLTQLLRAIGVERILATDPFVPDEAMREYGVEKVALEELLRNADIVSLHVRYDGENGKLLGVREFSLMKPGSIFVNTSRGELVDEAALLEALRRGAPRIACIDTLCEEPCRGKHPLAECAQVILTPHIAGACRSTVEQGALEVARAIAEYLGKDTKGGRECSFSV